jgi:precorrin-6B C5,15-methyltransferase / cobalt-precorrin-6B C5,C15-methyltransferase
MKPVDIVGTGLCFSDLSQKYLNIIHNSDILVGGRRHLAWFDNHKGEKREIVAPLSAVVEDIRQWMKFKKVVVLASGDPLFFGIGQKLVNCLGEDNVCIYPNISTMAACFSRLKMTWNQAVVVSLHGKDQSNELARALKSGKPVFVFTDPKHNPAWVGDFVRRTNQCQWCMWVFERLGEPDECMQKISPETASGMQFNEPNAVILLNTISREGIIYPLITGAPEHWYEHEGGLITKSEVRAVTLSRLRLLPDHVFWDLGAGSGSVAIEAAIFVNRGQIVAVEKNPERVARIQNNAKKFGVEHIRIIEAEFPEGVRDLPDPNRVFVGGGGKDLNQILEAVSLRLLPKGRVVVNTVVLETMASALATLGRLGFVTDVVQVQISHSAAMHSGTRLAAKNPVWIIAGER